jgi:signal peptidase I
MDENIKKVRLEQMLPAMLLKLDGGGEVVIPVTGVSMKPALKAGRDYAVLEKAPEKLRKNDIVLYRRDDGSFVLHRIIGEDENGFIMMGDNQNVKEYSVSRSSVIAVLTAVERNGGRISAKSFGFKLLGVFRRQIYIIRKATARLRRHLGKLKNGKKD